MGEITLREAGEAEAGNLLKMQLRAFLPLYEKYRDEKTSPYRETVAHILTRMRQSGSCYYYIALDGAPVGAIRLKDLGGGRLRVSPVFILPEYQGRGLAQKAFALAEALHPRAAVWELDTILEEAGNCHLYEKLGYRRTGETKVVNERMTIVYYEKHRE